MTFNLLSVGKFKKELTMIHHSRNILNRAVAEDSLCP